MEFKSGDSPAQEMNAEEALAAAEDELEFDVLAPAEIPGGLELQTVQASTGPEGIAIDRRRGQFEAVLAYRAPDDANNDVLGLRVVQKTRGVRVELAGSPTEVAAVDAPGEQYSLVSQGTGGPPDGSFQTAVFAALPESPDGSFTFLYSFILSSDAEPANMDLAGLAEDVFKSQVDS